MQGVTYTNNFIPNASELFNSLQQEVAWDDRMAARKTASFGKAYNYSQMQYPFQEFREDLLPLLDGIEQQFGFRPNNCLIDYYLDGRSKMGFHSDQTDILQHNTGVAIISLGEARTLRFRNIADKEVTKDYVLAPGSILYMTSEVQTEWQHAIPRSDTENGRMSLTFRELL